MRPSQPYDHGTTTRTSHLAGAALHGQPLPDADAGALRQHGLIGFKQGPGTGRWSYNSTISYYAPAAVAGDAATCT